MSAIHASLPSTASLRASPPLPPPLEAGSASHAVAHDADIDGNRAGMADMDKC